MTAVAEPHEQVTPVLGGTMRVETLLAAAVVAVSEASPGGAGREPGDGSGEQDNGQHAGGDRCR